MRPKSGHPSNIGLRSSTRPAPELRDVAGSARRRRFPVDPGSLQLVEVDRLINDFGVEASRASNEDAASVIPLGDPRHCRVEGSNDLASGHYEYCGLDEGFFAIICDITYRVPSAISIRAGSMLRVRIASEGDGEYAATYEEMMDLQGPSVSIVIEPDRQAPAEIVLAGRQRAVEIYIHRDMLERLYADDRHELPDVVRTFIAGDLERTITRRLVITPHLLHALEDLQNCPLQGRARRLVIRSRAIEILCHALDAFGRDTIVEGPKTSKQAAAAVVKARHLLDSDFADPPSLEALAHEVGLSRSGLCTAFRQIVGTTIFDYIGDLRMRQALTMLTSSELTIAEIAYSVGYGHPSSFSVAVQRRYGTTASELRRLATVPR